MTVELRPFGVKCNLSCHYCYQNPQREAKNHRLPYDLEKMKTAASALGRAFSLFGGEPLLLPLADLEDLLAWGLKTFGSNSIQTNGLLINDQHIELFKRYKVSVGISIDGPGELNDARWLRGGLKKTREATQKIETTIARLCTEYRAPGLITTLHKGNATQDKLPVMFDWIRKLDSLGIKTMRLHLLEVDNSNVQNNLALSPLDNIEALLAFAQFERNLNHLKFDLFRDMEFLLTTNDTKASCIWRACDPYTTPAVQGIEGNGQTSNCGRTNKDGIGFIKASQSGFERTIALFLTPQTENGCAGCRFFLMCKGQCPGTALDGDWRNRTEHCEIWKKLFETLEERVLESGKTPLSLHPRLPELEKRMLMFWERGKNPSMTWVAKRLQNSPPIKHSTKETNSIQTPRISWVSNAARDLWLDRLEKIQTMLEDMSVYSALENSNLCQVRLVPASSFHRLLNLAAKNGLAASVLERKALPHGIPTKIQEGLSGVFIVGARQVLGLCKSAYNTGDIKGFHQYLDLPQCCLEHGTAILDSKSIPQTIHSHTLLAPLGISTLPTHFCTTDCTIAMNASEKFFKKAYAQEHFHEACDWLRESLSWSLDYSILNGILEIKSPLFKMCLLTKNFGTIRIQRHGSSTVPEAARGLKFPYLNHINLSKEEF